MNPRPGFVLEVDKSTPPILFHHGEGFRLERLPARRSRVIYAAEPHQALKDPGGAIRDVIGETVRLWGTLDALERDHHLDFLRQPDLGFAWVAYRWAEGDELDDVLMVSDLAAGDFVRWMKQLIDLAGQVADAAGATPLRETAREVVRRLRRGVVAYSSLAGDE